jgi:CVNH domain/Divergent InlB B-repeat domain
MKLHSFLACAGLLLAATWAEAQVPAGSYSQSCTGAQVAGNVLKAKCTSMSGSAVDTSLNLPCNGSIDNINGKLTCTGAPAAGVPAGSYLGSCGDAQVKDGALFANCRRRNQTVNQASLKLPCSGPIDNDDGVLKCKGQAVPPAPPAPPAPTGFTLTVSPAPTDGDVTAFYKQAGTYAGVSCKAGKKPDCSKVYPAGTVLQIGTYDVNPGYGFQAWTGGCASIPGQPNQCLLTMNKNETVSATFATTVLTAAAPANGKIAGAGLDCGTACSVKIVPGTGISLSANANQGWAFDAWGGDCAGKGNPCAVGMTQNRNVTVTFKSVGTKTVTATAPAGGSIGGGGLNCGTTCTATLTSGQTVGFSANPALGYLFDSWDGACKGQGAGCSVTVADNFVISAKFKNVGTAVLTVSPAPIEGDVTAFYVSGGTYAGVSCKAGKKPACKGTYTKGAALQIGTYDIDPPNKFKAWSGACSSIAGQPSQCKLTMDGDKTVSATFSK